MSVLKKMSFAACIAVGVAMELVLTLLLLLPVAVMVNKQILGEGIAFALPAVVAGIAVFASESLLVRGHKKQALAMGATLAAIYLLLCALLCALGGAACEFGYWILWLGLAVFTGGVLSAVFSVSKQKQRKRRIRK